MTCGTNVAKSSVENSRDTGLSSAGHFGDLIGGEGLLKNNRRFFPLERSTLSETGAPMSVLRKFSEIIHPRKTKFMYFRHMNRHYRFNNIKKKII